MIEKKLYIINYLWKKYIIKFPANELDIYLKKHLSKQYFGNNSLYQMYGSRGFNCHCQIGSFICCLNLPLSCHLVRGELLSDVSGKAFNHGWIETIYKEKEYVIDTTFAKVIPKKTYYSLLKPKIIQTIEKNDLYNNKYALFIKKVLTKKNNLTLEKVYSSWWKYENNWLKNIDDDSFKNKTLT